MTDIHPQVGTLVRRIVADARAFREGRLSIQGLSEDLKLSIAALLQFADPDWVEELRVFRNRVEYVNAFFFESGRADLTEEERRSVDAILEELLAGLTIE